MFSRGLYIFTFVYTCTLVCVIESSFVEPANELVEVRMSGSTTEKTDEYLAISVKLPSEASYIVKIEPIASSETVHHMLLYGCKNPSPRANGRNSVLMSPMCQGGPDSIIFGWARDAPGLNFPEGVGIPVGGEHTFQYVVLQIHYKVIVKNPDSSGLLLHLSRGSQKVQYFAGLLSFAQVFEVPPKRPRHLIHNECTYQGLLPLHAFAFRVHTHALGREVWLERVTPFTFQQGAPDQRGTDNSTLLMTRDPQLPQGFVPLEEELIIRPGDRLRATCHFDSSSMTHVVHTGHRQASRDEMCNLYLMFYSEQPLNLECFLDKYKQIGRELEDNRGLLSLAPAPPAAPPPLSNEVSANEASTNEVSLAQPLRRQLATHRLAPHGMGQVGGVAVSNDGQQVAVFHRGSRVWDGRSFTGPNAQQVTYTDAIAENTIMILDRSTRKISNQWGSNMFFMPHGLSIDHGGNLWLTDCGLHQIMKFTSSGELLLTVGNRLQPGSGEGEFCKPTSVAAAADGSFFVADGYCNARVQHFSPSGHFIAQWGSQTSQSFNVPHSILIDEVNNWVIVADRENERVETFSPRGEGRGVIDLSGAKYKHKGGYVYAVSLRAGRLVALLWPRDDRTDSQPLLAEVKINPTGIALALQKLKYAGQVAYHDCSVEVSWLGDVAAPHDLALSDALGHTCGPASTCVFVGETRMHDSALQYVGLHEYTGSHTHLLGEDLVVNDESNALMSHNKRSFTWLVVVLVVSLGIILIYASIELEWIKFSTFAGMH